MNKAIVTLMIVLFQVGAFAGEYTALYWGGSDSCGKLTSA